MPLGKRNDCGEAKYAGYEVPFCSEIVDTIQSYSQCGFDFVVAPLVNPTYRRPPVQKSSDGTLPPPIKRSDLLLMSGQWAGQVVGRVSDWISLDSPDLKLRTDSCAQLRHELEWAAHLSLQATLIPFVRNTTSVANYAHNINQMLSSLSHMALWQPVPLEAAGNTTTGDTTPDDGITRQQALEAKDTAGDPWDLWDQFRSMCDHHERLGVVLEVGSTLPSRPHICRWYGEPVRALLLPTTVFITNKRGYPILSKRHQQLLTTFFSMKVQVILTGEPLHCPDQVVPASPPTASSPSPSSSSCQQTTISANGVAGEQHPMRPYWEYLSYLFRRQETPTGDELAEVNYRDYLQSPLQPLQDNLECNTYETFERDVTKYQQYEEAVLAALQDRATQQEAESRCPVVMVVGAGRGPLVRASLQAAQRAARKIRVYAVEKNPHALVALHSLIDREGWQCDVTVVSADMRLWKAPQQADVLVSELLGSFGDNELSPECLDGAQRFLRPDGISIPSSYTSYLQPVTSTKLWHDVKAYNDREHFETPYVVKLWRYTALAPILPVFSFSHPNKDEPIDNSRYARLVFDRRDSPRAVCNGFAGYFDTVLYGDVTLSTHPDTHTPHMFSWFPIYFPLKDPVHLPANENMEVHMWRGGNNVKVWYEWSVATPVTTAIHNPSGRSYFVGL